MKINSRTKVQYFNSKVLAFKYKIHLNQTKRKVRFLYWFKWIITYTRGNVNNCILFLTSNSETGPFFCIKYIFYTKTTHFWCWYDNSESFSDFFASNLSTKCLEPQRLSGFLWYNFPKNTNFSEKYFPKRKYFSEISWSKIKISL